MTDAERVHYQNYQAVGIAKRYIEGKRILTYEEYCKYYPKPKNKGVKNA